MAGVSEPIGAIAQEWPAQTIEQRRQAFLDAAQSVILPAPETIIENGDFPVPDAIIGARTLNLARQIRLLSEFGALPFLGGTAIESHPGSEFGRVTPPMLGARLIVGDQVYADYLTVIVAAGQPNSKKLITNPNRFVVPLDKPIDPQWFCGGYTVDIETATDEGELADTNVTSQQPVIGDFIAPKWERELFGDAGSFGMGPEGRKSRAILLGQVVLLRGALAPEYDPEQNDG